jgi:cell division protein FtsB
MSTPRTDAEVKKTWSGVPAAWVTVEFAKKLENELNEATQQLRQLSKLIAKMEDEVDKLKDKSAFLASLVD